MVFPVVGGTQDTGYEIENSLRFNKADSAKLSFTQGTPTSRRTWTYSTWVKRGNLADQQESILSWGDEDFFDVRFQDGSPDDGIIVYISDGDSKSLATNRLFRDPSAWYHIVIASDTTQSTAGDRTRIYVNGVEETSFASEAQPDQNYDYRGLVSGDPIVIGNRYTGSHYFDGYLAETHFIDGQQLAPTEFGETNDNGVWIPKKYLGTYGTNGFKLEFKQTGTSQNSSGIGADTSGNDNHFAVTNLAAIDVTTDTPTNNFSTFNVLANRISYETTFTEGNTDADFDDSNYGIALTTQAATSGKWYAEFKIIATGGTVEVGVANPTQTSNTTAANYRTYMQTGQKETDGTTRSSYGNTYTANDIISVAMDLDNGNIYFYKNGTIENSGTAAFTDLVSAMPISGWCFYAFGFNDAQVQLNTGNAPFSISSGNSDGAGHGNFEYSVPSGYFALCTKNLATYG
jgi:hypothetical protein